MNLSILNFNFKGRKYVLRLLFFLLCLVVCDRVLYIGISSFESHFYQEGDFEARLARYLKSKKFNTLIFGTSRTYEGIQPFLIKKKLNQDCFKEAHQGVGPRYNYYFYQVYKKYAGIPKVVIYGVDYFIYTVESERKYMSRFVKESPWEKAGFFSTPLLSIENKKNIDLLVNNIIESFKEKDEAVRLQSKDIEEIQKHEGGNSDPSRLIEKRPLKFKTQGFPLPPGQEGDYFVKLLDELQNDGVTVVLVCLPDFYGSLVTNEEHSLFMEHIRELQTNYLSVYVYNYNSLKRFPLKNPAYFLDGGYGMTNSHLSKEGAVLLNESLCKDLEKHYR